MSSQNGLRNIVLIRKVYKIFQESLELAPEDTIPDLEKIFKIVYNDLSELASSHNSSNNNKPSSETATEDNHQDDHAFYLRNFMIISLESILDKL